MINAHEIQNPINAQFDSNIGQFRVLKGASPYFSPFMNRSIHPLARVPIIKIADHHIDPQTH